jgi:triphosphoribosyl-dephospho-CoA synthase
MRAAPAATRPSPPAVAPDELARRAFEWACALDVDTRKPGNVSAASPGHGMEAALFRASAAAAAPALCAPGTRVGARIEGAVQAAWAAAGCNTNLGIVLLAAPVVAAAARWRPASGLAALRRALADVLAALDVEDARAAYRAIARANPGGLGHAARQDVAAPPTVGLRAAMALAADRDLIAAQYAHGFPAVFDPALPAFAETLASARHAGHAPAAAARAAMLRAFLELLAAFPDSHIVRKHGAALAHSVMAEAVPWRERARRGEPLEGDPALAAWDESLKRRGLNPGTSADLAVAAALVAALAEPALAVAPAEPDGH